MAGIATAQCAEDASPVVTAVVGKGNVADVVELTGTVTAERQASLSARTAGLVKSVAVEAGSRVEQGDVILELDAALAELALERATEAVNEAKVQLVETRRLFDEGSSLAKTGGIPRTEAEARAAALQVQDATLKQLEVDRREQAEIVARHELIAPFSGVIGEKMTEVGEWVETGVPVLELVEVDAVRFDVQAPQELFPALTPETPVTVRLDSRPDAELPATVTVKVPVKDPVTRTFLVRLAVEAPSELMVPGVSGRAIFRIASDGDVLTVPRDALVRSPDGSVTVWAVADGVAVARRVETGDRMAPTVEIKSGLAEGEQVIVRGNEVLRDGQAVKVIPAEGAEG